MKPVLTSHFVQKSAWVTLSLLASVTLAGISQPAQAQTSSLDLQTPVGSSDRDASNNGDLSNLNSMFNLMHRAQQGNIRDPYQFSHDQQQIINTQATDFRQRQAELLRQQGQMGATPPQIVAPTPVQPH
ncbi:MAG TPA: hypothetical protein V6C57_06385 [Coleofasciculaceae cyanobacterium]